MDDNTIESLKEALKFSPENVPLRLHLAQTLFNNKRIEEAEKHFQIILEFSNNQKAKFGLAQVFYAKGDYSKTIVVLEELIGGGNSEIPILVLNAKALLKEGSMTQAIEVYKRVLAEDPHFTNEELDAQLRLGATVSDDSDTEEGFEETPKNQFVQKPSISFKDVGGMENIKKEIDLKIIQPLLHPEIYKAYGKKIGGGILLYGPPGCGKTYLAKATAGQVNAKFISVSLNDILDMWMGNSEKNLHEVFTLARQNTPCVLFFDEIDALGASRSDMKQSSGRHLINQFLQELDGMENDNEGLLILGATNTPWHLDSAFRRPGRFDRIVFVPPPDQEARQKIFQLKLANKPIDSINYENLSKKTKKYSGADIEAIIDIAVEGKLEEAIRQGIPSPLTTKDLQGAIKRHKPTTTEWFASAKNFALYANESGLYDEILNYLKIKN